jgi:hypothetical protein
MKSKDKTGSGGSSGSDGNHSGKGSIDREGQIKLGILIRRMYEADLQKQAPDAITDLVKQFDKSRAPTGSDEGSRS